MSKTKLPVKLLQKTFTLKEALSSGLTRYELGKLIASGQVSKIGRNLYISKKGNLDEESILQSASERIGEPSAICLLSALAHYGLTDEIPKRTWILVPQSKRARWSDIRLIRSRRPEWSVGIEKEAGYQITNISRSIVDALIYKRLIGTNVAMNALRKALQKKLVKLPDVLKIAKQMRVEKRIVPYIEAFL